MKKKYLSFFALAVLALAVFAGCAEEEPVVEEGVTVRLNYTGTLDDGTEFDSSEGREPLEFVFGSGQIIPGLEEGLQGLTVGATKTITVPAEEAYGPRDEEAIIEVPRDQLPPDLEPEAGMQLAAQSPQGVVPVTITEVKEESVMVDFNHPLAGENLTFNVEIVEIIQPEESEAPAEAELPAFEEAEPLPAE